jgi:glycosyltransferase involved in cell wall biosynthesis
MAFKENSKKNNFFLSICIPTFNRADKIVDLVKTILSYKENNIEVVVLDNCSTDNTHMLLNEITDNRFVYVRNNNNIGSMPNVLKALTHGSGEFIILCLDKDTIISENLPFLIQRISEDKDVIFGQCALNTQDFEEDIVYQKGLLSLIHLAYTSEHPSGLFVKRSVLVKTGIIDKIIIKNKSFAFNPELLKAELAILGKSRRINIPLVHTETLETCEKELSHTYKGDNIYFFPKNIIETFNIYIENLFNLNITKKHKKTILKKIYLSLLNASTFGFKSLMKNKSICSHHGINTRNVSVKELIKIGYAFFKAFIKCDLPVNFFYKFYICILANMKIIYFVSRIKFIK